jgi:hypothetical protein
VLDHPAVRPTRIPKEKLIAHYRKYFDHTCKDKYYIKYFKNFWSDRYPDDPYLKPMEGYYSDPSSNEKPYDPFHEHELKDKPKPERNVSSADSDDELRNKGRNVWPR